MRTIQRDCVVGIIVSKDGKILMGMKDPQGGGVYADCWHLPGGGIEAGESQMAALNREMLEEVGLDIADATVKMIDDSGRGESEKRLKDTGETVLCKMKFFVYKINLSQPAKNIKLQAGDDLQKLQWLNPDKLLDYKLTPPSHDFFSTKMHLLRDHT